MEKEKTEKQQKEHYAKEGTGETRGSVKRKWKGEKRTELVPFLLTHSYRHTDLSVSLQSFLRYCAYNLTTNMRSLILVHPRHIPSTLSVSQSSSLSMCTVFETNFTCRSLTRN